MGVDPGASGAIDMEIKMYKNDYLVEVKIKNNWLMKKIKENGYENGNQFAKAHSLQPTMVNSYLSFKEAPYNKKGEWRHSFIRISEALRCLPEDICPPQHLEKVLKKNKSTFEASLSDIAGYLTGNQDTAMPAIEKIVREEDFSEISSVLQALTPREERVIRCRFGMTGDGEMTLAEVGQQFGVTNSRIMEIEAKALRKLKHPSRAKDLKQILRENFGIQETKNVKNRHYVPQWKIIEKLNKRQSEIDRQFQEYLNDL
jgi:RNA polymerase sigma factor (sigma-70 family)